MHQRAVLAGGCFWGMQDLIRKQPGRVSEILCERHTMMLPRSMYATQEEDAGGHAGH